MLTGIGVDPTLARARPAGYAEALAEGRSAINRSAGSKANNADVEIDDHAREEYWSEIRGNPSTGTSRSPTSESDWALALHTHEQGPTGRTPIPGKNLA
jgi:hypothetical protein